jgi:hypothetical protein
MINWQAFLVKLVVLPSLDDWFWCHQSYTKSASDLRTKFGGSPPIHQYFRVQVIPWLPSLSILTDNISFLSIIYFSCSILSIVLVPIVNDEQRYALCFMHLVSTGTATRQWRHDEERRLSFGYFKAFAPGQGKIMFLKFLMQSFRISLLNWTIH